MEPQKLTQEEIDKLNDVRKKEVEIIQQIGELRLHIEYTKKEIKQYEDLLDSKFNEFDNLKKSIQDYVSELEKKYGKGIINIDTGTFQSE